jgi:CHAT domain-containing protein
MVYPLFVPGFLTPIAAQMQSLPIAQPSRTLATAPAPIASTAAAQLFEQGLKRSQVKDWAGAIALWQQGLNVAKQTGNRATEAKILVHLGHAYYVTGADELANASYQQGLALAKQLGDRPSQRLAMAGLGAASYAAQEYAQAIAYQQQSLELAQTLQDAPSEMVALRQLGMANDALGRYSEAVQWHQRSLAIARRLRDRAGESVALRNLGLAQYFLADYAAALATFEQELAALRQQSGPAADPAGQAWVLGNLAIAHYYQGDYAQAIQYHQQRLALARQLDDPSGQSLALGGLGIAYYYLGDYTRAITYQQQSLDLARQLGDPQTEGVALANLGNAYFSLGDDGNAIAAYQQSLPLIQRSQHRQSEITLWGNVGRAYLRFGNPSKALEAHQRALAMARQLGDRQRQGVALGNVGSVYQATGDFTAALRMTRQWLALAQQIGDRPGQLAALDDVGLTYQAMGQPQQAIAWHQQSLALARQTQQRYSEGLALDHLGRAYFRAGNLAAAAEHLNASIQVWESQRQRLRPPLSPPADAPTATSTPAGQQSRDPQTAQQLDANTVSLLDTQVDTYRTLQQVLVAQQNPNAALEIAERSRARAFAELLATRLPPPSPSSVRFAGAQHTLPPTVSQIQQIAQQQQATLVAYSLLSDVRSPSAAPILLYLWVIQPTGAIAFRQITVPVAEPSALRFRPDPKRAQAQLQQLHRWLIQPIADLLPASPEQRVVLIPQGALFYVPFAALQDAQGHYLIERHTVAIAPSIQVLGFAQRLSQARPARLLRPGQAALIVGNPVMPSGLAPLPAAEVEAGAIASLFQISPMVGAQATKAAVISQMPQAEWIHLATHGIFDPQQGLNSSLALTPTASDDGFLRAEHLFDLRLKANLVVLSACNTGRGKLSEDGVVGLSRAFMAAGVPSVVVTLWSVPDQDTQTLMVEFYQQLQQTRDRAQALRQALLRQKDQNPIQWAAFTLIGAAD